MHLPPTKATAIAQAQAKVESLSAQLMSHERKMNHILQETGRCSMPPPGQVQMGPQGPLPPPPPHGNLPRLPFPQLPSPSNFQGPPLQMQTQPPPNMNQQCMLPYTSGVHGSAESIAPNNPPAAQARHAKPEALNTTGSTTPCEKSMYTTLYYAAWRECLKFALQQYPDASQMVTDLHMKAKDLALKLPAAREGLQKILQYILAWLRQGLGDARARTVFGYLKEHYAINSKIYHNSRSPKTSSTPYNPQQAQQEQQDGYQQTQQQPQAPPLQRQEERLGFLSESQDAQVKLWQEVFQNRPELKCLAHNQTPQSHAMLQREFDKWFKTKPATGSRARAQQAPTDQEKLCQDFLDIRPELNHVSNSQIPENQAMLQREFEGWRSTMQHQETLQCAQQKLNAAAKSSFKRLGASEEHQEALKVIAELSQKMEEVANAMELASPGAFKLEPATPLAGAQVASAGPSSRPPVSLPLSAPNAGIAEAEGGEHDLKCPMLGVAMASSMPSGADAIKRRKTDNPGALVSARGNAEVISGGYSE